MAIYLDVLILVNMFVNYFLLLSTKALLHRKSSKRRMFIASLIGGLGACMLLLPPLVPLVLLFLKLSLAFVICLVAFEARPWRLLLKNTLGFYFVSFIYAGFMMALWYFITPIGMQYRNGVAYFKVSSLMLLGSTVATYFGLVMAGHLIKKTPQPHQLVEVVVGCDNQEVHLNALVDTGNQVSDLLTGYPVVFCEWMACKKLMPEDVLTAFLMKAPEQLTIDAWKKRIHMVPISTVTGKSLAMGFLPEYFAIITNEGTRLTQQVIVAVVEKPLSDGEYQMIIGETLL